MKTDARLLIREAKHSYAVLLGFINDADSVCNKMLLKWPDAMDSLIADDEEKFCNDMSVLMCQPLKVLAESLAQVLRDKVGNDSGWEFDVTEYCRTKVIYQDPQEAKKTLIKICNTYIDRLRINGVHYSLVKTIVGEIP